LESVEFPNEFPSLAWVFFLLVGVRNWSYLSLEGLPLSALPCSLSTSAGCCSSVFVRAACRGLAIPDGDAFGTADAASTSWRA